MISSLLSFASEYAAWLVGLSLLTFIVSLLLLPFLVTRIPVDYFCHPRRERLANRSRHPLFRLLISGLKNVLGLVLILLGIAMLFLPGQGLLSIFIGLMVMNYPGKYRLERWIIQRPAVLTSVNWLRRKYYRPPLQLPKNTDCG